MTSQRHHKLTGTAICLSMALLVGGCAAHNIPRFAGPELTPATPTQTVLSQLPAPREKIAIAVYGFTDQTGQFKPTEAGQTLSRAVTQGATSILVKALQDAGNRSWFTVVERERLENLLKERQIIREMRMRYLGEKDLNPQALPPLLFAGVLLEGGIIGYDTNTMSGGAGARFLGIGASTEYRQDTVTVYLRAISTKTGEVLSSVVTRKSIASIGVSANTFRYVSFKELLEAEAGFTTNEPDQLALQQAIEKAVHALIMEGNDLGLWQFADRAKGQALIDKYRFEKSGIIAPPAKLAATTTNKVPYAQAANPQPTAKPVAVAKPVQAPATAKPEIVAAAPAPIKAAAQPDDIKRTWYPSGADVPAQNDLPTAAATKDLGTDNATLASATTVTPDAAPALAVDAAALAESTSPVAPTSVPATNPAVPTAATSAVTGVPGVVMLPGGGMVDTNAIGDSRNLGPMD